MLNTSSNFKKGDWSAYRSWLPGLYGFGKLKVYNSTHLYWEQILEILDIAEDWITVEQQHHGPFPPIPPSLKTKPRPQSQPQPQPHPRADTQ